ncbi:hypothetical protein M440DRAFT_1402729 [Trichoderma longibrachiatum ATCC 18648]|uniref:Uncharacterized protein n=1 Tax=Trichoderma longibrachiatum ATCC 18648 TaxID=983965 RepID=A0A2T4C0R3_TRILO|nr:hypothetical protein M440DRAFT_1402729 [Trichoderma longibrachiatum ATCC 18648]
MSRPSVPPAQQPAIFYKRSGRTPPSYSISTTPSTLASSAHLVQSIASTGKW